MLKVLPLVVAVLVCAGWARAESGNWSPEQLRAEIARGKPLVVKVVVVLCSNDQIDCGSQIAGRPGNLSHNIYWGAIFGARRFLERKNSGFERISLSPVDDVVLERAVYRRRIPAARWGLVRAEPVEQIVVLDAVHGSRIDTAVRGFWQSATGGERLRFPQGDIERELDVHVVGYVGHNRLLDGVTLPSQPAAKGKSLPSFVLACKSEGTFSPALRRAGSEPLVMTRDLMAPEGYVLAAVLAALGDGQSPKQMRQRAVAAYARWQRLSLPQARWIFAPR